MSHAPLEATPLSADASALLARLEPALQALLAALAPLAEAPFTLEDALVMADIQPVQPATLAGLAEVVVGPGTGPAVSNPAQLRLEAHLSALAEAGVLVAFEGKQRLSPLAVEAARGLPTDDGAAERLVCVMLDGLEAHRTDVAWLHEYQPRFMQAIAQARRLGMKEHYLYMVGWTCGPTGFHQRRKDFVTRLSLMEQAVAWAAEVAPNLRAWTYFNLASLQRELGELGPAEEALRAAVDAAEEGELTYEAAMARGELAAVLLSRGELEEAERQLEAKRQAMESLEDPLELADTLGDLADLKVQRGELDEGQALMEERLELLQAAGEGRKRALALATLGDVLAEKGDFVQAAQRYQDALPTLQKMDPRNGAVARANLGIYLHRAGELAGARDAFLQAREAFTSLGLVAQVSEVDDCLRSVEELARHKDLPGMEV